MCPHVPLEPPALPQGGWKIKPEVKEAIEEAYTLKESGMLWQYMANPNPLVRAYAHRMYDALKAEEKAEALRIPKP